MSLTYTWTSLSVTGLPGSPVTPTSIPVGTLTFSDAAVAAGSFSMSEFESCPAAQSCTLTVLSGDPSQVAFLPTGSQPTLVGPPHQFNISVTFNPDHTLSGHFIYDDPYTGVSITGSELAWSGSIRADWLLNCPMITGCGITGYFSAGPVTQIPEPASVLLVASLIGAGMLARMWRAS